MQFPAFHSGVYNPHAYVLYYSFSRVEENEGEMDQEFLPMSHQLGRVARVQPFNVQGMKNSILYDDEEEYVAPSPRAALKPKNIISGGTNTKSNAQNLLNASLFQPLISESPHERSVNQAKKPNLFKTGLLQKNSSSLGKYGFGFVLKKNFMFFC